ncbi:unnamed protein product [Soboliphyme baturini]|uniref:Uncharacterized protein n=1 Tax=Soboliphyme baturini TaxID=241478 RepID=A0A183IQ23_9BILA|nr:unnamed protein product [Soboliphyme baturini]
MLSECPECLSFLRKVVRQLARTSDTQRLCMHDEFQRWIDQYDGNCSDSANKLFGDFSNHHYSALTVRSVATTGTDHELDDRAGVEGDWLRKEEFSFLRSGREFIFSRSCPCGHIHTLD